jgi:glucarate dehydratase
LRIVGGAVQAPQKPGLGIEIDMGQIEKAHDLFQRVGTSGRDDTTAMQYLISGWQFEAKRPCLMR